ncbi:MAG TPA: hypothetical protein ENO03_09400 [Candidatus Aminicenantes bacterium]|nr:hypothetical protein [Candidatus Aminicenantes bacterium]
MKAMRFPVLFLLGACVVLASAARAEIVVRLEATAESVPVHLEPDDGSPVVETLSRGDVVKLSSPIKFRTHWYYVLFVSSRSGRTLTGYVVDGLVRKLNSTLKVVDLTPAAPAIDDPAEFDLRGTALPEIEWGVPESVILRSEGRPFDREHSGDMEFLRYHRELLGKKCLVTYVLIGRKLGSVRIHLLERYANKDRYVADYNSVRDFLNAKLGSPRYDNVIWKDRAYAERGDDLGTAVTSGTLSLSSEWAYRDMGLRISLSGENSEVLFAAEISDLKTRNPTSF